MKDSKVFFQYDETTRREILKRYNRDENSVSDDVKTIREWCRTQPHLPETPSDRRIETHLVLNKFSIEKTKMQIDMYYTMRHILPEFYLNPKSQKFQEMFKTIYLILMPKLTPDHHRILISKLRDTNPDRFDPTVAIAIGMTISEIRLSEDYALSDIMVFDFEGITTAHLLKHTPIFLKKCLTILQKVFSNRLKAIHYINAPPTIDMLISAIKSIAKPKIANRIFVHTKLDTFYAAIPRKLLPKDYGGDELSLDELQELIWKKLADYQERFDLLDTFKIDESLRPEKLKNDDLLGFYGNFRKLDVD